MRDKVVLRVLAKIMIPFVLVFGFYVITHGEIGPGGGFQGGVILASAVILYSLIFGLEAGQKVIPRAFLDFLMVLGICIYAGWGVVAMFQTEVGGAFLDYGAVAPGHPGAWEAHGMAIVETGVGITVAAVMVTIFNKIAEGSDA